jgi:hypothetical protein
VVGSGRGVVDRGMGGGLGSERKGCGDQGEREAGEVGCHV